MELCSALVEGGLTPSYGLIKVRSLGIRGAECYCSEDAYISVSFLVGPTAWLPQVVCKALKIPVNVLIRPRAGDFLYTCVTSMQRVLSADELAGCLEILCERLFDGGPHSVGSMNWR